MDDTETTPVKTRVVLVTGAYVDGVSRDLTADELAATKAGLAEVLASSDGWQINIELPSGSWAVFPKASVLYIALDPR